MIRTEGCWDTSHKDSHMGMGMATGIQRHRILLLRGRTRLHRMAMGRLRRRTVTLPPNHMDFLPLDTLLPATRLLVINPHLPLLTIQVFSILYFSFTA